MGRKIPGRKHRGVKDPAKQQSNRLKSLRGKINAPPSNPDFQETPHSITKIAKFKERIKNQIPSQKVKKRSKGKGMFEQRKGESDKHFLYRVHQACDAVIKEKAFGNKYGVEIKRNRNTGEVEKIVKRPKDELEVLMEDSRNKNKRKSAANVNGPSLTKSQKRQKKLREKKLQTANKKENFDVNRDVVKFGEVVHSPPSLSIPKGVKPDGVPRPGTRDLLLKSVIQASNNNKTESDKNSIDKCGKRKNLPNALRRRIEKQQQEVIEAYRALKKQKNLNK